MITFDGLSSGLDTESIVKGLLDIQQTQLDRTELKRQDVINRQTAFQTMEAQLVAFRSSASSLARSRNNIFEATSISVSDESALVASSTADAAPGVYQLTVDSFARAHQVASQGFAAATSEITHGTFTLQQGDRPPVEITIDDSNDTLQGLADAINLADSGVSAALIQDGDESTPFRLLLTSSETGEANAITVTNNLAATAGSAQQPAFDFGNPVQAATNAAVRLGSGPGALVIENDTNRLENVINGVTLDLLQEDPAKTITLRVQQDTEGAIEAVQGFVDSYNSLMTFINEQTSYNSTTETGGLLLGNRAVVRIQNEVQSQLQQVVPGISSSINRLSTIGIQFTDSGTVTFDSAELSRVMNGEVEGASASDVRRLFGMDGVSTNSGVEFLLGSSRTQQTNSPIEVDITQAAEQAFITSTNTLLASTILNSFNNQLSLELDGVVLDVTLGEGVYSQEDLASELQSVINAHPDARGRAVRVGLQDNGSGDNLLTILSETYGDSSEVRISGGSAMAALGLNGTETDKGEDVEGFFRVNGVVEQARGRGRLLSAENDNEFTSGLQLRVTLKPDQVVIGNDAEMTITRGAASLLDQLIGNMQNEENGLLKTINDSFTAEADGIQDSIDRMKEVFEQQEQDLLAEFVALESAMTELNSTGEFLTSQFAQLSSLRNNNK